MAKLGLIADPQRVPEWVATCPTCGVRFPDALEFCPQDGTALPGGSVGRTQALYDRFLGTV